MSPLKIKRCVILFLIPLRVSLAYVVAVRVSGAAIGVPDTRCRVSLGEPLRVPWRWARRGSAVASSWVWASHFLVTRLTAEASRCYCFDHRKSQSGSAEALVKM